MPFPGIFLMGATGRIGRVLQGCWPARGIGGATLWQARRAQMDQGPDRVVLDPLQDPGALAEAARGCDVILCLAGVIPGAPGHMADNWRLARAAIRAGAEVGARVILVSSAAVYGRQAGTLGENTPLAPVSDYGRAKAGMERAGADLGARLGVAVSILRIGNIAGADAALGNWHPGFRLDRFADGRSPRRSYIGPVTLARVLGALCCRPTLPEVLNVAAPGVVEMGALLDAAGLRWTPRPAPDTAIAEVRLDTRLLRRIVPLDAPDPGLLVQEWRLLETDMIQETGKT